MIKTWQQSQKLGGVVIFYNIKTKKAFTLVELIITITILIILSTIAFLSFWNYTLKARDTVRYSDLKNIQKVMDFKLAKWLLLPLPNNLKEWFLELEKFPWVNWREWEFWEENFKEFEELSNLPLDPKEKTKYKYFLTENWEYYYLETELENGKKYFLTNYEGKTLAQNTNQPSNPNPPLIDFCEAQTYKWYNLPKLRNWQIINTTKKENKPTNGKTTTRAKANCNSWTITITDENVINIVCDTWYELHSWQCVAEPTDCTNPIYRHDNGVTIKARSCAVAWQEYEFEGKMYYVAENKGDIQNKIQAWYSANRIVTTRVTDMGELFSYNISFNQDISNWDVSNVTNMEEMFASTKIFNQPLDKWNVSNVTNMEGMFASTKMFNQSLDNWDVSKVTNMKFMFSYSDKFNQPLNTWNTSNVKDLEGIFRYTDNFNQPLYNWDVSKITSMRMVFQGAIKFNQDISNWDVSKVTNMNSMFFQALKFNQPLDNWNVSNVTNMDGMFVQAREFNQSLNSWDVSNVTNMEYLFASALKFNQPLNNWNTSKVTDMKWMFQGAINFNQDISNWDVSKVTDMWWWDNGWAPWKKTRWIFEWATKFNKDLSNWNTISVTICNNFAPHLPSSHKPEKCKN